MYFIYVFYLKSPPPVSHPPCTFFNQVLHIWYTVNCLDLHPPHLCTKKNQKLFTVHSSTCPSKYSSPHQSKTKIKNSLRHYGS